MADRVNLLVRIALENAQLSISCPRSSVPAISHNVTSQSRYVICIIVDKRGNQLRYILTERYNVVRAEDFGGPWPINGMANC